MATAVCSIRESMVIVTGSFASKAMTAVTAFAIFQTIVMALVALGCGGLLTVRTGTTKIDGSVTEGVLPVKHS